MGNAQRDPSEDLDRVPFPAVSCCPAKECMLTASFSVISLQNSQMTLRKDTTVTQITQSCVLSLTQCAMMDSVR